MEPMLDAPPAVEQGLDTPADAPKTTTTWRQRMHGMHATGTQRALVLTALGGLLIAGVLTVILVLMHSGKGTGVSDMIASSLYNAGTGSGILEKNLDRLTVITATVFIVCVIVMALTFPLGAIG